MLTRFLRNCAQRVLCAVWVISLGVCGHMVFLPEVANAAFGNFMPLRFSGSLTYNYGYVTSRGTQSENTGLTGRFGATGYVWQPWFATTSASLNVGLTNVETNSSSSDSTVYTGTFGMNVFPRSRFPFSLTYSRSDSQSESFSDLTQVSGSAQHSVTRLSLRQLYRARDGALSNAWYYTTDFEGAGVNSNSETFGLSHRKRWPGQYLSAAANYSRSSTSDSSLRPTSVALSVNHTYTPAGDLGVNSLVSYVETSSGGADDNESTVTQASSSFSWRPEHRTVSISGGVRASESRNTTADESTSAKSLNTNFGLTYRLTRRLRLGAGATLGTSESSEGVQTLSATQSVSVSYFSSQLQILGGNYSWQTGINGSNSSQKTDADTGGETTTNNQNVGSQLGHSFSRSFTPAKRHSFGVSLGQALSVSKSSGSDEMAKGLSHSVGGTWTRRGQAGSTFGSLRASESRSYGETDSTFQQFGANLSQELTLNRLSGISASANYQASRQESESEAGKDTDSLVRGINGNLSYRHSRPFGVYNLTFSSRFSGSKQIDVETDNTRLDLDNRFQYSLGKLSTSMSLRIIESGGGVQTKTLRFQATRSF